MSLLSTIIDLFFWFYIHGPLYQTEIFIDDLQMTSNPDTYLTPPMTLRRYGYQTETHTIRTPDGFILELERIPNDGKQTEGLLPILLIHGYPDSSFAWIADGPGRGLAYLLADQGYDVWMINIRGNKFSQSHAKYTPQEKEFWDFSFHEIGVYDVPTTIDFILKKTNQKKLFCICDSAGNPVFYITLSVLPQYSEKIIAQVSLAPYYHESSSNFSALSEPLYTLLDYLYQHTPGQWMVQDLLWKLLIKILTTGTFFGFTLYEYIFMFVYNWKPNHVNKEIMPAVYNNYPAGTSVKATQHFIQMTKSFSYFDYGPKENLKIYGTISPPEYNISNVQVPVRIYHSLNDVASSVEEVHSLYNKLPLKAGFVNISDPEFCHEDYILNKNVKKLLYDDVIKFVNYALKETPQA